MKIAFKPPTPLFFLLSVRNRDLNFMMGTSVGYSSLPVTKDLDEQTVVSYTGKLLESNFKGFGSFIFNTLM